jgi:hypothetical protein
VAFLEANGTDDAMPKTIASAILGIRYAYDLINRRQAFEHQLYTFILQSAHSHFYGQIPDFVN